MRIFTGDSNTEIYAALHNFIARNADDPKAAIILTDVTAVGGLKIFILFLFYAEPTPPTVGPFAEFLKIKSTIDSTSAQNYADLVGPFFFRAFL
jgi:hypothetical protein